MTRVVGLDIGSGFVKAYNGDEMTIFPSVYSYRESAPWDPNGHMEGVGSRGVEISRFPDAITISPVVNGKPLDRSAYVKLIREAFRRLHITFSDEICLVTGLPYQSSQADRESLKSLLTEKMRVSRVTVLPQPLGPLYDLGLTNGCVCNIGHSTTEFGTFDRLNLLSGLSERLASDFVLGLLSNRIQSEFGLKLPTQTLIDLISAKVKVIDGFTDQTVHVRGHDISDAFQVACKGLVQKLAYDVRALLTELPPGLECSGTVILSGGGSMIRGIPRLLEKELGHRVIVPNDPIYSTVLGYYKAGLKLYGHA
jgi:rod shape-determining protein MreB